jgi:hypothetical protein
MKASLNFDNLLKIEYTMLSMGLFDEASRICGMKDSRIKTIG